MNIIIIHGDNTEKSYQRILIFIDEAKRRNMKIEKFDKHKKEDLQSTVRGETLFDEEKIYLVYGLANLKKNDLDWIKDKSKNHEGTLIVYEKGIASQTKLKNIPKGYKIEKYELPKLIFKFLDSFYPGNKTHCIKLFHEVIKDSSIEFVFSLLGSHLKDLYWVMVEPSKIPYPSWRVAKLENQAEHFDLDNLKDLINKLAIIDVDVKTSDSTLINSLDLLIIGELE